MTDDGRRRVEELRRELARQDEIWARAKEQLRALGDVQIALPDEALREIERAFEPRGLSPMATSIAGIRA